ncbi:MAG: DMT family transporter [bacterium]|nr:DMT family transporter [bacterium]
MSAAPHSTSTDNLGRALAWMVVSGLSFAFMAATVKYAGDLHVGVKVFFRNLVTLGITGAVAWRTGANPFAPTPHAWRLVLRSLCGFGGVILYFVALGDLNLADASLLNKTSPFFVTVFAVFLLGEPLGRSTVGALAVAFAGAALVLRPSLDVSAWPAVAGLVSGAFAGMAYTLVRSMQGRESPNRIIFTFSLFSTLATLPVLIAVRPDPTPQQWAALVGTGIFAAGGQYGLTFAYHHARAGRVSVFTYLHVLFALVLGFVLFDERPDLFSLAGGLLIVGAAVWVHRAGRRRKAN